MTRRYPSTSTYSSKPRRPPPLLHHPLLHPPLPSLPSPTPKRRSSHVGLSPGTADTKTGNTKAASPDVMTGSFGVVWSAVWPSGVDAKPDPDASAWRCLGPETDKPKTTIWSQTLNQLSWPLGTKFRNATFQFQLLRGSSKPSQHATCTPALKGGLETKPTCDFSLRKGNFNSMRYFGS